MKSMPVLSRLAISRTSSASRSWDALLYLYRSIWLNIIVRGFKVTFEVLKGIFLSLVGFIGVALGGLAELFLKAFGAITRSLAGAV
jgi:hypothetical protein